MGPCRRAILAGPSDPGREPAGRRTPARRRRVFSGIQPTGDIHLGNYLGAIKQLGRRSGSERDNYFCIVDLHSLTVPQDAEALAATDPAR